MSGTGFSKLLQINNNYYFGGRGGSLGICSQNRRGGGVLYCFPGGKFGLLSGEGEFGDSMEGETQRVVIDGFILSVRLGGGRLHYWNYS